MTIVRKPKHVRKPWKKRADQGQRDGKSHLPFFIVLRTIRSSHDDNVSFHSDPWLFRATKVIHSIDEMRIPIYARMNTFITAAGNEIVPLPTTHDSRECHVQYCRWLCRTMHRISRLDWIGEPPNHRQLQRRWRSRCKERESITDHRAMFEWCTQVRKWVVRRNKTKIWPEDTGEGSLDEGFTSLCINTILELTDEIRNVQQDVCLRHWMSRCDEKENNLKKRVMTTSDESKINCISDLCMSNDRFRQRSLKSAAVLMRLFSREVLCFRVWTFTGCLWRKPTGCLDIWFFLSTRCFLIIEFHASTSCWLEVNQVRAMMIYLCPGVETLFIPFAESAFFIDAEDQTLRQTAWRMTASSMVPR